MAYYLSKRLRIWKEELATGENMSSLLARTTDLE